MRREPAARVAKLGRGFACSLARYCSTVMPASAARSASTPIDPAFGRGASRLFLITCSEHQESVWLVSRQQTCHGLSWSVPYCLSMYRVIKNRAVCIPFAHTLSYAACSVFITAGGSTAATRCHGEMSSLYADQLHVRVQGFLPGR